MSAAAALLALMAGVGLSLIGIAVHLLAIAIVTAGLLICVVSCWYVVSRRGLRRLIALGVALAALAGMAAGLVFAHINWPLVVVILVLGAVSVAAARQALGRTDRHARAEAAHLARGQRPQRGVLIMNPKSGGGKAARFALASSRRSSPGSRTTGSMPRRRHSLASANLAAFPPPDLGFMIRTPRWGRCPRARCAASARACR
ncbi:MAG: hypothetical protein ACHP9Z_26670, partial [Streptosporangiales bacterium]